MENNRENINSNRKKKLCLTIEQKLDIIERLERGEKHIDVAHKFGVVRQTITHINQHKIEIRRQASILKEEQSSTKRKRYTAVEETSLEKIVFSWFLQKRELGTAVSGSSLQEVAAIVNAKIGGPPDFKASSGWLKNFQHRHGIREFSMQGERLSADSNASTEFCVEITEYVEANGFDWDNVYNADETGLLWKCLPDKTQAARNETSAPDRKLAEDRITIMTCTNCTGTHKIPLLVIGKLKNPRCFKNVECLPVPYTHQKNAWMDQQIFLHWYTAIFLPSIKSRKPNENFLLILDNAPSHPSAQELNNIDPCCIIKFLPPNVTSFIQGIIVDLKRLYKKEFLREFLIADFENDQRVQEFLKSWNLLRCLQKLSVAWSNISQDTAKNAWNNIFQNNTSVQWVDNLEEDIRSYANRAFRTEFSAAEITAWLDTCTPDCGWGIQTVDELIAATINPHEQFPIDEEEKNEEEEDELRSSPEEQPMSNEQALHCVNKMYQWYMSRWDSNPDSLLHVAQIQSMVADLVAQDRLCENN